MWITAYHLKEIQAQFAKLNRRAAKLGVDPMGLVVTGESKLGYFMDETGKKCSFELIEIDVTGCTPKLSGWNFIAKLEHGKSNIVSTLPGIDVPEEYWTCEPACQHCNTKHRRKVSFIIEKDSVYRQVGRNCLADYMDSEDAVAVVELFSRFSKAIMSAEYDDDDDMDRPRVARENQMVGIEDFLNGVLLTVHHFGYLNKANAEAVNKPATCHLSWEWCVNEPKNMISKAQKEEPAKLAKGLENEVVEWIKTLDASNQYYHNLKALLERPGVCYKHIGLLASAVPAWRKANERMMKAPSEWIGEVKKRETFKLNFLSDYVCDTEWGTLHIMRFALGDNIVVWKTTNPCNIEIGDTVELKATVKEHSTFKGAKQTVITRAKLCA